MPWYITGVEQETKEIAAPVEVRKNRMDGDLYRWDSVEVKEYRKVGDFFRDINKQVFFDGSYGLSCELRYFEVQPGGYSSLEQHEHVHGVLVLRGRGRIIATSSRGSRIEDIAEYDVVYIPGNTWHQLHAASDEFLGFLCLVDNNRDRPRRPSEEEAEELRADPVIGDIIKL